MGLIKQLRWRQLRLDYCSPLIDWSLLWVQNGVCSLEVVSSLLLHSIAGVEGCHAVVGLELLGRAGVLFFN
jgi:hypothetical protein